LNIVIDTNVIVAALIRGGVVRALLLRSPGVFLTPESCIEEAWETRASWNRGEIPEDEIEEALEWLVERVLIVVPRSSYRDREGEAATLIAGPDDVPVVALALSITNEGIWTFNTRDFSGSDLILRTRVLTTSEVKSIVMDTP